MDPIAGIQDGREKMRLGSSRGWSTRVLLTEPRFWSFKLRAVQPQRKETALWPVGAQKGWELGRFRKREIHGRRAISSIWLISLMPGAWKLFKGLWK